MFSSFVIHDMVEVEPVYFPQSLQASQQTTAASSSAAVADHHHPYAPTLRDVLLHRLTERYVGRVIPRCGLCVAIGDICDHAPADIKGPCGSAWVSSAFTVCVFRPAAGTRMRCIIQSQCDGGMFLGVDFAAPHPIFVPSSELLPGSRYNAVKGAWYMPVEAEEDNEEGSGSGGASPDDEDLLNYYANGEDVVVRVMETIVRDALSCGGGDGGGDFININISSNSSGGGSGGGADGGKSGGGLPLMEVLGSFVGDGLGPTSWFEE